MPWYQAYSWLTRGHADTTFAQGDDGTPKKTKNGSLHELYTALSVPNAYKGEGS